MFMTPSKAMITQLVLALFLTVGIAEKAAAQGGPLPVDVAKPIVKKVVDWDEFTGRFEAVQRVDIRPRVSGFVQEVKFRDGQLINEGDILFIIDPRPFIATLDQAKAALVAARAEQTRASVELKRGEELVESNTLAQSVLDQRRAEKLNADAQVAIAEATIRAAQLNVDFTEVRAPFQGRISDRKVNVGSLDSLNETIMATIVTIDPIHLVFTGSEGDFLRYSRLNLTGERKDSRTTPNPVEARLIDEEGWPHKGTMNFVDNELDANAGTIRARAVFENKNDFLAPGLFARLRLIGSGEYTALLLPDAAILSDQARKIVMISDKEGNVSAKTVKLGPINNGLRIVRSGITADDLVIVNGVQRARPGGKVLPQEIQLSDNPVADK